MYIKALSRIVMAKAGEAQGGGGAAQQEEQTQDPGQDDQEEESPPLPEPSQAGSILLNAIKEADKEFFKNQENPNEGKEKQEKPINTSDDKQRKKAEEVKEEKKEPSEDDEFDPSNLRTATGQPPSAKISEFIEGLRTSHSARGKTIGELKSQLTEKEKEIEQIKTELNTTKEKLDIHYFEHSDAFKNAFIAPVQEVSNRIAPFFKSVSDSDRKDLVALFDTAMQQAESGSRADYYKSIDRIVSEFMDDAGNTAIAAFGREMDTFYDAIRKKTDAFNDKSENRKKIAEIELERQRSSNINSIDSAIDRHLKAFEVEKQGVLQGLKGKELEDYKSLYQGEFTKLKKALNDFAITGKISNELAEVISGGITNKAVLHENNMAWTAFKMVKDKAEMLEKELEDTKKRLARYTSGPGSGHGSYNSKETPKKKEVLPYGSVIVAKMREIEAGLK